MDGVVLRHWVAVYAFVLFAAGAGCAPGGGDRNAADAGIDAGSDTDSDTDSDMDSDTDTDTDSDTDSDTSSDTSSDTETGTGEDLWPDGGAIGEVADQEAFFARYEADGAFAWVAHSTSYGIQTGAVSAAALAGGGAAAVGRFSTAIGFGEGLDKTMLYAHGDRDMFLVAYSDSGELLWARRDGGDDATAWAIAGAADGGFAVAGTYGGGAVFGDGEPAEIAAPEASGGDAFVARYDADGAFVWAGTVNGLGNEQLVAATVGTEGAVYASGAITGAAAASGADAAEIDLLPEGSEAALLCAWDGGGAVSWCEATGGAGRAVFRDLSPGPEGGALAVGRALGEVVFGAGSTAETTIDTGSELWIFAASYAADGELLRIVTAPSDVADVARIHDEVNIDAAADGFYLSGRLIGEQVFGPGEGNETVLTCADWDDVALPLHGDVFAAKYAGDGTLEWAVRDGGTRYETCHAGAVLEGGAFALTGAFSGWSVFGEAPDEITLATDGTDSDLDPFVAVYGADGALAWARRAGGLGASERGTSLASLPDGAVFAVGWIRYPATFGEGETTETIVEKSY